MEYYVVYKIVRDDLKSYIGMTKKSRLITRMREHKRNKKFKNHVFSYSILHDNLLYESACELEEKEISNHNSYFNGLNETKNGKGNHKSKKFTTYGYKHTKESKLKMSKAQKKRKNRRKGYRLSEETKHKISKKLKGRKITTKLTVKQIKEIKTLYNSKPKIAGVGIVQRNGKELSYNHAFAKKYHKNYGITDTGLRKIISGETWSDIQV